MTMNTVSEGEDDDQWMREGKKMMKKNRLESVVDFVLFFFVCLGSPI